MDLGASKWQPIKYEPEVTLLASGGLHATYRCGVQSDPGPPTPELADSAPAL